MSYNSVMKYDIEIRIILKEPFSNTNYYYFLNPLLIPISNKSNN